MLEKKEGSNRQKEEATIRQQMIKRTDKEAAKMKLGKKITWHNIQTKKQHYKETEKETNHKRRTNKGE